MKRSVSLIALMTASVAMAEETRELSAHEHGVGTLDIAVEDTTIAMRFAAPGADIVGFEYEATSQADIAAIDAALATLSDPLALFAVPAAAGCGVTDADVVLIGDDGGHDDHDDDHAKHDEHDHDEHDHDDHADHDDHDAAHAHDDHDDDHAEVQHSAFEAAYTLTCSAPEALTQIAFDYFDLFENALEVEVQVVTEKGAQAFEVDRTAPVLDLNGLL